MILLGLIAWRLEVGQFLFYLNYRLLLAILLTQPVLFLGFVLFACRFRTLTNHSLFGFRPALKAVLLSLGLNIFLFARLSELVKPFYLKKSIGVPVDKGMAIIFLERSGDGLILIILTLVTMVFLPMGISKEITLASFFFLLLVLILFARAEAILTRIVSMLPWGFGRSFLTNMVHGISNGLRQGLFYKAHLFGFAAWGVIFVCDFLFLRLCGSIPMSPLLVLAFMVCTTMGIAVPLLPAGIGTYEAGGIFVLMKVGYSFEEALSLAMSLHFAQLTLPLIGALLVMTTKKIGFQGLRREARIS